MSYLIAILTSALLTVTAYAIYRAHASRYPVSPRSSSAVPTHGQFHPPLGPAERRVASPEEITALLDEARQITREAAEA